MENLLFLVHRIPYPPNKGDKIRSYHFLQALSAHYRVYLGTFIDDPEDWNYESSVQSFCKDTCIQSLQPLQAKIKSLEGLLTGSALSVPYYRNKVLQTWVDQVIEQQEIKKVLIFSSVMAQYVAHHKQLTLIVDFVDVDSDKWRQYALKKSWPESWLYRRESERLLDYERQVIDRARAGVFVSELEAELFKSLAPEFKDKVKAITNGVDTDYFSPEHVFPSPYPPQTSVMVFTGAMDYWANVDAVKWFAEQVFPALYRGNSLARFYIVGSKPTREVLALGERPGVTVTGAVKDIRPYLASAHLVVAPLRIARGIQNKVLEAMAMGKKVMATSAAMEGIPLDGQPALSVIDDAEQFAEQAGHFLKAHAVPQTFDANRNFVLAQFSWQSSSERLISLIG
ncbi:MAG: sugar transferase [Gammaproteobacteria bacterium HGW-Gammaproteobacteria-3]|nr:MAG: sugar transferase [Gammaproteobacteria bacterium HGW-Gammaproteobacteria-3]